MDKKTVDGQVHVRLCNYTDVYSGDRITPSLGLMAATATPEQVRAFRLVRGDVIITKDSEDPTDIGVPAFVAESAPDLVCGYHLAVLRPATDRTDGRYLYWAMGSQTVRDHLSINATGITRYGLRTDSIAGTPIPWWPLQRQRAIATFLDAETARIDSLIAKKRRLIGLLDERFSAYRARELLGPSFDPITGAGALPSGWRTTSLGICIQLQRGHDLPDQDRVPGDVPIISSGGPSGWHSTAAATGPGVVTGRYGTVGESYYVDGPYWPLNTTLYVKDFRSNHPRWVLHLLAVLPLNSESTKSAVGGINRNVIGMLRVPLPPIAVQRAVASRVDEAASWRDTVTASLTRQIDLLVEHRQALITAAVTGELSVPGVAA